MQLIAIAIALVLLTATAPGTTPRGDMAKPGGGIINLETGVETWPMPAVPHIRATPLP